MGNTTVVVRRLESEHRPETFAVFKPLGEAMRAEINVVVSSGETKNPRTPSVV